MSEQNARFIRIRIGVIIVRDDKILLIEHVKNGHSYWLIPGGGLNYGETIEECAKREMKEETNLDISLDRYLFSSETIAPDGSRHIVNLFFLGEINGDSTMSVGDEERLRSLAFVPVRDLEDIEFHPPIAHLIKRHLSAFLSDSEERHFGNFWESYPDLR